MILEKAYIFIFQMLKELKVLCFYSKSVSLKNRGPIHKLCRLDLNNSYSVDQWPLLCNVLCPICWEFQRKTSQLHESFEEFLTKRRSAKSWEVFICGKLGILPCSLISLFQEVSTAPESFVDNAQFYNPKYPIYNLDSKRTVISADLGRIQNINLFKWGISSEDKKMLLYNHIYSDFVVSL